MSVSPLASPECRLGRGQPLPVIDRERRRFVRALGASLALSFALSACGKKGELELPSPEPASTDAPSNNGDAQ